jgi:hypothetical protein
MSRLSPFTCRRSRSANSKRLAIVTMLAMLLPSTGGNYFVPTVSAQTAPVGAGFELDAGDLRFIRRQIDIAQAHAAGGDLFGPGANQVPEPRLPFGLRTVDGSFNHLVDNQVGFGAADRVFPRLTASTYRAGETFDFDGPGPAPATPTSYSQTRGVVVDSTPRVISNLIADQTVRNPAAVAIAGPDAVAEPLGTLPIGNVAPDVGLSAPFNSMFTFFGQFFDHGLDLVTKGGGTVFVPLKADDPLFVPGSPTNFMALTRATNQPGPDGIAGDNPATPVDESADDIREATNTTTPFVDQNQTYTSHPSHQVFLREYAPDATGRTVPTGRLIDGGGLSASGAPMKNIGNWAEVKAQAVAMLGIALVDTDVFNVPLLVTDPYGHFVPGPGGYPMMMMANNTVASGTPAAPITTVGARKTGHGFLDDIAHNAVPTPGKTADADGDVSTATGPPQPAGTYDDELLNAHFVTGDGRGNENIALTAVHAVFHAEHNRLRDDIDSKIHSLLTPAEIASWETTDPASGWTYGERLFQAARFVTEMEYQHLVFEEFARKVSPTINPFVGDGINFTSDVNPAISAEFAHQVYRLGHSMLTETIARTYEGAEGPIDDDIPLLDGFLNPLEFNHGPDGPVTAAQAAGAIFQGGTRQVGMEIDEFVTEAVRNRLLGLPLDLAVLNLARGRSEGVASLNAVRRQLYNQTGDGALVPYSSWLDFQFSMKHVESLANYIAAYGTHPSVLAATSVAGKREAGELLAYGASSTNPLAVAPADRMDFLFSTGAWASGPDGVTTTGVDGIDLWMGGLGEQIAPFGGLLGSTFNYIFEVQLENLQNADRFYYLERLDGLNLLPQLEANSFSELISRNTTLNSASADVFARPDFIIDLNLQPLTGPTVDIEATPDFDESTELTRLPDGTIRYDGPAHVIWVGRDGSGDRVHSSEGDDTLRGNGGNDRMEGGSGNDQHIGGLGDDILTDLFGDDVMKGGPGNDAIHGGAGFDLLQGNEGADFIVAGNDSSESFGGSGNDIIYVGQGFTEAFGGGGDDWMEGTDSPASVLVGDENNQLQNDPNGGHDVILAGPGDADFDMEGGDDIMVANVLPTHRLEGMLGFDWATYRGEIRAVDADMLVTGATAVNVPLNENRDRYDLTEGLSGTNFNDLLRGDDRVEADLRDDGLTGVTNGHVLTTAGIARITGLAALLPAGATEFAGGNIILGGAGSDIIEGRGGNDIIDGDRWLNVQLEAPGRPAVNTLHDYKTAVFAGLINPASITIVRSIVATGASAADVDTAMFSGPRAAYIVTNNGDGTVTVDHQGGADGVDTLRNIELLAFSDGTIATPGGTLALVPNLATLATAAATAAVEAAGLTASVTSANSSTVPLGIVISQSPAAGTTVTRPSVVSFVVSLGPVGPPPAPAGLVLALGFNEASGATALDASGGNRNGTILGALRVPGQIGGALAFDGVNDWVTVPDSAALDLTTAMTVEAWVRPAALNGWDTVVLKERGANDLAYGLYANDGAPLDGGTAAPSGVARASGGHQTVLGVAPLAIGVWTHVATTYDGTTQRLFINGAEAASRAQAGLIAVSGGALRIGGNASFASEFFQGTLDEVRVYNRALTATEIAGDMAGATVAPPAPPAPPPPSGAGLVLSLNFDEATGSALDTTANAAIGTIRGAVRVPGVRGNALSFDGVDDWVTVPDSAALDLTTGMTLQAWVRPNVIDGWETVLMKQRGAGDFSYALYSEDGAAQPGGAAVPSGNASIGGSIRTLRGATQVPAGAWTHVATTFDGVTQRLFVNGVEVANSPQVGTIAVGTGVLRIGGNSAWTGEFFSGLIDEVRIFNRALTAAEIAAGMNP